MMANVWYLKRYGFATIVQKGLRVAVVLSLARCFSGEFIGAKQGLGALIIASQGMMDTTLMFVISDSISNIRLYTIWIS